MAKSKSKNKTKEWEFKLTKWHPVPELYEFIGSSFVITRVETECHNDNSYSYSIFIAPLPNHNPLSKVYKSVMDASSNLKKKRKLEKLNNKRKASR